MGIGVLGCADVADRRVLPAVAASRRCHLVAVASRTERKAREFAERHGAEAMTGYAALLERDDVDAVYLPLPSGLHAEWIERALRAGKHVLAEKPLTLDGDTTDALLTLAEESGLVLRENFMFCHHPMHGALRDLVDDGAIGELRSFSSTFAIPARPEGDIRHRRELGGGALHDTCGYPVRAAQMFLGPALTVHGTVLREPETGEVDLGGAALLARPDGVFAQVRFGLADAYTSAYEITGSTGRIEVSHVFTTPVGHVPEARLVTSHGSEPVTLPAADQFRAAVDAFAGAVRKEPDLPEWGHGAIARQARLIDAIRTHARPVHAR
ncbi:hypothetical protein BJF85_11080 [Saccharomonospora sp. CUA-673]|nr:hypothetical protein BJF85_11080 [Saccharomonospora sp. CUA-673]